MKELFDCMDALVDVEEVIRKTAPNHELKEEDRELVLKKLKSVEKNLGALKKRLGVQ